jgi:hypothetical protein
VADPSLLLCQFLKKPQSFFGIMLFSLLQPAWTTAILSYNDTPREPDASGNMAMAKWQWHGMAIRSP